MSNILVVGSGGREHAIVWKLSSSENVENIFVAPGSFAIGKVKKATNVDVDIKDFEGVASWCKSNNVSLVVVGPEDPLANGIADVLTKHGIHVFGPEQKAANIESNKDWAKSFMDKYKIPTARWKSFDEPEDAKNFINTADFPALVVKASGLAAGKGVVVALEKEEACEAVDSMLTEKKFGAAGETVVVEELLEGEEVSVLAFCDGETVKAMLPAQDHKRIWNDDFGPNTGGMGAYCPCPLLSKSDFEFVETHILQATVDGLRQENINFVGVLYAGLMLTKDGPKVLEFNCRFGDPETEVLLPLLENDLYEIMLACCTRSLNKIQLSWYKDVYAVGVVLASRGYPETSSKGQIITGSEFVNHLSDHFVFHCGTAMKDGNVVTNGGRVMIVVCLAHQLAMASGKATNACEVIKFDGKQYRTDIAHKGIPRTILDAANLTYKASGVDISAGNDLVTHIKPLAKSTNRPGVMGGLGGFGGLFDTKLAGFKDPLLVSGTDGVGTKLKIAQEVEFHSTIGIDLVAMCVNDVLAHGAEPLFFLDYFSCGALDVNVAKEVISGIAEGCKRAGCALIGGETAEMPSMYKPGEYDLAGFAVGAVERKNLMPFIEKIEAGDSVIALPSSGVHSNGFSLVRKVMELTGYKYSDAVPFNNAGKSFAGEFLTPTEIYVKAVIPAMRTGKVKAFAHITGGGLLENIPRILPPYLGVDIDAEKWTMPAVFPWLAIAGGIAETEMLRTFNCGVGAILIVKKSDEAQIMKLIESTPEFPTVIGKVVKKRDSPQVIVRNFSKQMEYYMRPHVPRIVQTKSEDKKRVAVLISGSGTNLKALIEATIAPYSNMECEIVLVISNKPGVGGLTSAKDAGIRTKVIKHRNYPNREDFDMAMNHELMKANVEFICAAGFMRILSSDFIRLWKGRLINIHPAILPSFKGMHAVKQALDAGVKFTGCTVHFVEPEVDDGPIIIQEVVPVSVDDTVETLQAKISVQEHKIYKEALRMLVTGKIKLDDKKIIWS